MLEVAPVHWQGHRRHFSPAVPRPRGAKSQGTASLTMFLQPMQGARPGTRPRGRRLHVPPRTGVTRQRKYYRSDRRPAPGRVRRAATVGCPAPAVARPRRRGAGPGRKKTGGGAGRRQNGPLRAGPVGGGSGGGRGRRRERRRAEAGRAVGTGPCRRGRVCVCVETCFRWQSGCSGRAGA
jgi:hypothetical protein